MDEVERMGVETCEMDIARSKHWLGGRRLVDTSAACMAQMHDASALEIHREEAKRLIPQSAVVLARMRRSPRHQRRYCPRWDDAAEAVFLSDQKTWQTLGCECL